MINRTPLFVALTAFLLAAIALTLTIRTMLSAPRVAYVVNETLFAEFEGKKDMESKLLNWKETEQKRIDSLFVRLANSKSGLEQLENHRQEILAAEQSMNSEFTQEIWSRINQLLGEYSKDNGYDYVFGASGNGSLMYAGEYENITEEVIDYINARYDGSL